MTRWKCCIDWNGMHTQILWVSFDPSCCVIFKYNDEGRMKISILAEVTPAKFKWMSFVNCQQQLLIALLISNCFLLVIQNQDTVPTTPKISFMDGIKMTNRLMITKRTKVTKIWRHKSNFVFLAISNNDERTCRETERVKREGEIKFYVKNSLWANSKLSMFILTGSSCDKCCIDLLEILGCLM